MRKMIDFGIYLRSGVARGVWFWALAGAVLGLAGCSHAVLAYRLEGRGADEILVPPRAAWPVETPAVRATLANVRRAEAPGIACDIEGSLISVKWHGRDADVEFRPERLAPNSAGEGSTAKVMVDPLLGVEAFRRSLTEIEARGCIGPGESYSFRQALAQKLPLPPFLSYRLLVGSFDLTGAFDLSSDFRLAITSPVYADAARESAAQLTGHETAYYSLVSSGSPDHVRIALATVTETPLSGTPVKARTPQNHFPISESLAYWRVLFRSEQAGGNSITRAILLSAANGTELDRTQEKIRQASTDFCASASGPDVSCYAFPASSAVNPELRVMANGKPVFVQASYATLGGAVDVQPLPKDLRVRRLFEGRLIPVKFGAERDAGEMQLMPGDRITW
jgi:hypothetical protein